ncbi:MAG: hypothetical protein M0D55_05060 [Elusimicrobiota bacterium]|nr:MAG: hypothetical protein M0D55_05060 [Elusimicrobiota bacterium]
MWLSTETKSPFLKSRAEAPTSAIVPQNSWPNVLGVLKRSGAQELQP